MREQARRQYDVIHEKNLPMKTRDGTTLYADIVRPDGPGRFPALLSRTPYGKDTAMGNNEGSAFFLARHGYVTVMQDCRGRFTSEGEYYPMVNDIADGYDAVAWAARLPWSNGRVGTFGQSYMGASQYMMALNNPMPPQLQAMIPVSAAADYHQGWVYHTGGAMLWGWAVPYAILKGRNTLERLGRHDLLAKMDEYVEEGTNFSQPLREEWFRHLPIQEWAELLREAAPYFDDYIRNADDGEYWSQINVTRNLKNISVPMLHVSSWYDIFLEGALDAYQGIKSDSEHPQARRGQRLFIGPWGHLFPFVQPTSQGTGDIDFGPEALVDLHDLHLRWFDYWLKDVETGVMDDPPVTVFTMGENRWKTLEDWPPPNAHYTRWYLHSGGQANTLNGDGSISTIPPGDEPADTYVYDPNDPVPTLGGANLSIPLGVQDQTPVENRQDVLVFTSDPMERPLEVTGPIKVRLWAASTAPDTDFTAKLVDVHPDGYAQNLQDGIIRARYRDSSASAALIEPGQVYEYTIDMWATSNVFLRGHRIRLEISSSNFPRFDRNPNTGALFGVDSTLETATQTIQHRSEFPSHIVLPIIPR
ncbi:MAG: CocE/NonD family hydrolase [Chloroflexi bacterium]|nr:CocE/NonD family hydrolase [Chloroflexota bacterium]